MLAWPKCGVFAVLSVDDCLKFSIGVLRRRSCKRMPCLRHCRAQPLMWPLSNSAVIEGCTRGTNGGGRVKIVTCELEGEVTGGLMHWLLLTCATLSDR